MPESQQVGWQVLDSDGNVVESGSATVITAVSETGDGTSEE